MIQDDGVGFDTSKERKATSHGVTNMYTRTRGLGGDMDIMSVPGKGTTIIAWLPVSQMFFLYAINYDWSTCIISEQ